MNIDIDDPSADKAIKGVVESIIFNDTVEFPDMYVSCVVTDEEPWVQVLMMVDTAQKRSFLNGKAKLLEEMLKGRISGCDIKVSFIEGSFIK